MLIVRTFADAVKALNERQAFQTAFTDGTKKAETAPTVPAKSPSVGALKLRSLGQNHNGETINV